MNKSGQLLSLLMELPPRFDVIENELKSNEYTPQEVTDAACRLAEECFLECRDFEETNNRKPETEEVHSSYIYEACKLLLSYGLNPNLVSEEANIMYELSYIDNEDVAAKTIRLLLENGGSVDIYDGDESLFERIDFDIIFDITEFGECAIKHRFKVWLVMIGYGATIKDNQRPVEVVNGYGVEQFKSFENFTYEIEYSENDWIMHIIDVRTNAEAARL